MFYETFVVNTVHNNRQALKKLDFKSFIYKLNPSSTLQRCNEQARVKVKDSSLS